jgi:hypothetical protein
MKLSLDADDYRKLVELAYLGEWLINAHHDPEYADEHAGRVLQQLLAAPELPGVGRDQETGEFYMDNDWLEKLYDNYILDYDDHVFWDELTERLAQRDLARQRGVELEDINRDDDLLELKPLEDRYHQELENRGIERIEIAGDY